MRNHRENAEAKPSETIAKPRWNRPKPWGLVSLSHLRNHLSGGL